MRRSVEWFIALRYLVAKRRQVFISAISAIGVGGIAAGVCLTQILLNADADVAGLPPLTPATIAETIAPVLADANFRLTDCDWLPPDRRPRSRWGGRLVRGSHRRTVALRAERGDVPPASRSLLDEAFA